MAALADVSRSESESSQPGQEFQVSSFCTRGGGRSWPRACIRGRLGDRSAQAMEYRDTETAGAAGPKIAMSTRRIVRPTKFGLQWVPDEIAVCPLHLPKELLEVGIGRLA